MNRTIKIGFLAPRAERNPHYMDHLMSGFLLGMRSRGIPQSDIKTISVNINKGSIRENEDAARKLLYDNQVDILSGLVSYISVIPLIPLLTSTGKTGLFFEMGEYVPYFPAIDPNIFYCSNQLWQAEFALGRWASQTLGTEGMILIPPYESGYHLDKAFCKGMLSRSPAGVVHRETLSFDGHSQIPDLTGFFEEVRHRTPAYVHPIIGGLGGIEFLKQWKQSDFHKRIPLLVNETMADEELLGDSGLQGLEMYASLMWDQDSKGSDNQAFITEFASLTGQKADIFALLGYEAGIGLGQIWDELQARDTEKIKLFLQNEVILGPRGKKSFYPASDLALPETTIFKVDIDAEGIHRQAMERYGGIAPDAEILEEINMESLTGSQIPFTCI